MPTTEEQVTAFAELLRALPGSDILSQLRQALPCGFDDTTQWISRQPEASVRSSTSAIEHDLSVARGLASAHPDQVASLADLHPADPRIPVFMAQITAAWPAPEAIQQAAELLDCAASTLSGLLAASEQAPPGSNLANIGAAVSEKLGSKDGLIAQLNLANLLTGLAAYRPGGPPPALGTVLDVQDVSAPLINTAFSPDGDITANDTVGSFTLPGHPGSGFVQSRVLGPAAAGTVAAGLTGYLYRVDLSGIEPGPAAAGVSRLVIPTGVPVSKAWPGGHGTSPLFAVTEGATGSCAPREVRLLGHLSTVVFDPPLPPGQSSYFIGMAALAAPTSTPLLMYPAGATTATRLAGQAAMSSA